MKKEIQIKFVNKENRVLFKYFILVFLVSILIINWNEISWLFNYRAVSGLVSDTFRFQTIAKTVGITPQSRPLKNSEPTDKENTLEIPKLGISVPLIFSEKATKKDFSKLLDQGAVYFPGSVLPGEAGQTVILGHSAPAGWPKIKHDWIFTRLDELTEEDEIFVYFNHRKYTFHMNGKFFLDRGEELPQALTSSDNVLVLISCWPPGQDLRRIAVTAE